MAHLQSPQFSELIPFIKLLITFASILFFAVSFPPAADARGAFTLRLEGETYHFRPDRKFKKLYSKARALESNNFSQDLFALGSGNTQNNNFDPGFGICKQSASVGENGRRGEGETAVNY